MANPVVTVPVAQDAWTKVATAVLGGTICPTSDAPKKYLFTYRLTGQTAPTLRAEGATIEGASQAFPSGVEVDLYCWCVGAPGAVSAHTPYISPVSPDVIVDGETITGNGSSDSPLVAVQQVADGETITGDGTEDDPFVAVDNSEGGTKVQRVDDPTAWEAMRKTTGLITAVADAGDGFCLVAAPGHQQSDGSTLTISGTIDYDDAFEISGATDDAFLIEAVFTETKTGAFRCENVYKAPGLFGALNVGDVVMQRFTGGEASASVELVASGVIAPLAAFGHLTLESSGEKYGPGVTDGVTDNPPYRFACDVDTTGALKLKRGTAMIAAADRYDVTVVYIREVTP
jgi:hypothetical protein